MKYAKKILVLLIIVGFLFNIEVAFASDKNTKKDIAQFYHSVMNEDGYITCAIDITEKQNHVFKLDMVFKENINGIDLGFYVSPYILQFMETANMKYDSGFEGSYLYTIGSGKFDSLKDLSFALSRLPFIVIEGDKSEFFAKVDLTVWDDIRKKDNFVDDIYKTNYFLFSYKPLKHMDTNASCFENGMYVWKLNDREIANIYATEEHGYTGLIIIIIGIVIFAVGIYLILKKPFNKKMKRKKNKQDEGYGYQDDYYY